MREYPIIIVKHALLWEIISLQINSLKLGAPFYYIAEASLINYSD